MTRDPVRRRWLLVAATMLVAGLLTMSAVLHGQEASAIYLLAIDGKGKPVLDVQASDIAITELVGPSTIVSVERFGLPLKVTVLVDNGLRSTEALVHFRTGLKKFFDGLPPRVPVSLIATAPNPRWLFRETADRLQIEKGVNLITIDDGLGRFSDALVEYAERLDKEFQGLETPYLPYLPVLVSIATAQQDGSEVRRESNLKMLASLRKHRVWTTMITVAPNRAPTVPGGLPVVDHNAAQNAELAKGVQEATGGRYVPMTGSGTSALTTSILPELAQEIALRYIKQMTQHRIVFERPPGANGPMKKFSLSLLNHPGVKIVLSTDGAMP